MPLLLTADRIGSVVNLTRMSVSKLFSQWQREGLMIRHGQTSIVQSAAFCLPLSSVQIYTISCTALHPVVHAAEFFTPAADSSIEFFF